MCSSILLFFQNVEMRVSAKGTHYASDFVSVPEGEYDGQIVLGSSYSYIYPVRKFIVEQDNDMIMLELDPKMLETPVTLCGGLILFLVHMFVCVRFSVAQPEIWRQCGKLRTRHTSEYQRMSRHLFHMS